MNTLIDFAGRRDVNPSTSLDVFGPAKYRSEQRPPQCLRSLTLMAAVFGFCNDKDPAWKALTKTMPKNTIRRYL